MPKYKQVDWEQAECRDTYTELFYRIEEERNQEAYRYINAVRSICGRCPIQKDCLAYAFGYEDFGVWGGLTSLERAAVANPERHPNQLQRAVQSLKMYGISLKEVREIYEHSSNGRSLANRPPDHRENGVACNCRSCFR